MRSVRSLVVALLASVVLAVGHVALVLGNSTYTHIGRLPNPQNDAADMSALLQRLGFEIERRDLTEREHARPGVARPGGHVVVAGAARFGRFSPRLASLDAGGSADCRFGLWWICAAGGGGR